jgi:NADPH2:quinone reductase
MLRMAGYSPTLWPSIAVEVVTSAAASEDAFIRDPDADVAGEMRGLTGGRGVDVVYDVVGGVTTSAALALLAHRGRLVVITAVGSRTAQINLIDLYHNETRIIGSECRTFDMVDQPVGSTG